MRRLSVAIVLASVVANPAVADGGQSKVSAMLKRNSVVAAAVAQAKKFAGAKTCDYDVKATEVKAFEKGTTFDYSADISCGDGKGEGSGTASVAVKGRFFSSMPDDAQALELSVNFAN